MLVRRGERQRVSAKPASYRMIKHNTRGQRGARDDELLVVRGNVSQAAFTAKPSEKTLVLSAGIIRQRYFLAAM